MAGSRTGSRHHGGCQYIFNIWTGCSPGGAESAAGICAFRYRSIVSIVYTLVSLVAVGNLTLPDLIKAQDNALAKQGELLREFVLRELSILKKGERYLRGELDELLTHKKRKNS